MFQHKATAQDPTYIKIFFLSFYHGCPRKKKKLTNKRHKVLYKDASREGQCCYFCESETAKGDGIN